MFIELIGWIVFFKILIDVAKIVFAHFSSVDYKRYGATENAWAVVTGASDGIGEEFAVQLAQKGFNTILIARRQEKLQEIATRIQKEYNRQTKVISFDFSKASNDEYKNLIEEIKKQNIRILINNVGVSYQFPKYFHELDESNVEQIIEVNVNSALKLTHGLLTTLRDNAKEKGSRSVVVNVSSATSQVAAPLLAVYAGSKSFINAWSEAISSEYSSSRLDVVTLSPWFVSTQMSKQRPNLTTPLPSGYVRQSLKSLTSSSFHGGFTIHSVLSLFISLVPVAIQKPLIKSFHAGLRARAMKKYNITSDK